MEIKRYRGADMQEALQKVKQDLGTDAVILSTRQVRGGGVTFGLFGKPMLEVTAARDLEGGANGAGALEDPLAKASLRDRLAGLSKNKEGGGLQADQMLARSRVETQHILSPLQDEIHELKNILKTVGDAQRNSLRDENAFSQMRGEISEMRQMVNVLATQSPALREGNYPENLVVLFQQLLFNGVEEKFARRLTEEAQKNIPEKELEDFTYVKIFLARMLMKIVKVTGGITAEPGKQKIFALVGPTGVGKTTSVAKLASEQLLRHRKKVALITVDTFRIAAVEQLKTYAKIMGVPIAVVNSRTELQQAIGGFANQEVILIDSAGRSQKDDVQMTELQNLFGGEERIEIGLALSATTKDTDITDISRKFGELPISSVLFTKLDESSTFGALFNHAIRFKMPISHLTTGQNVPEDIEVATKERLVDLLLHISAG